MARRYAQNGPRILIAAALGKIIEPVLAQAIEGASVRVAENRKAVAQAVSSELRFDVVVADLIWNDYTVEYSFDGLDVFNIIRRKDKQAPVIFAAQGHGMERDHLDEAVEKSGVAGIYRKASGPDLLVRAVEIAAHGNRLPESDYPTGARPPGVQRLHSFFSTRRGNTAARLAAAIASGRAVDHETLAKAAGVRYTTAARLVEYFGPLIIARGEHPDELRMTPEVVYRWCGEHARYILSWCRRNKYGAIAQREIP